MKITIESFKPANEIPPAETISALFYGQSGTGKTEFASTAPRPLYIDVGRSKETILSKGYKLRHPNSNPLVISISEKLGKLGAPDAAEAFDATCDAIDFALKEFPDKFDSIVIDELTGLGFFARTKGIYYNSSQNKSNTKSSLDKDNILAPAVQDYGAEMNLIEQFIRGYADICMRAGKHFIVCAHEQTLYGKPAKIGDPTPVLGCQPLLTGKATSEKVCSMFDWVFRFDTVAGSGGKPLYRVKTVSDGSIVAKCKHSGVFDVYEQLKEGASLAGFIERAKNGG